MVENSEIVSYCCLLYFMHSSNRDRKGSCSSSRDSSMKEEGVVLRRGPSVRAPSEEKSTVVSMTPSVSIYTNNRPCYFFVA
jgi:hypothetical protein